MNAGVAWKKIPDESCCVLQVRPSLLLGPLGVRVEQSGQERSQESIGAVVTLVDSVEQPCVRA
eukprot:480671-Pyramimonas_sp.AAC.2